MNNNESRSKKITLIIGLSIPVAMIIFIAVAINGPRWFSTIEPPVNDFLYLSGQQNPYASYVIKDGRLVLHEAPEPDAAQQTVQYQVHFFVHDVQANKSKEVTFEEAQQFRVDGSVRSPDGYSVEAGRRGGWFIFGYGRDYKNRYLVKDSYSEKLDLESSGSRYNYYWNFQFLGWITGEQ